MYITAQRIGLLAPHVNVTVAAALALALEPAMPQFGLTSLLTRAHFMAQACHESAGFTRLQEDLNYTHATAIAAVWARLAGRAADLVSKPEALANAAYAGHNGNGDEASGDGWAFRGRGLFQLTGRANYRRVGAALREDLEASPDLVSQPRWAALTALEFWKDAGCNTHAVLDDCDAVTRAINGPARAGLTERRDLTERAKQIFI